MYTLKVVSGCSLFYLEMQGTCICSKFAIIIILTRLKVPSKTLQKKDIVKLVVVIVDDVDVMCV